MKLLFSLLILLCSNYFYAQCPPGDVELLSQTDVDNFVINYPNCSTISGYLKIEGNSITDISGLSNLTTVDSFIEVKSTILTSLSGLDNLTSIGGYLDIYANGSLPNLNGLTNLSAIGGYMRIRNHSALTNLNGLENVTSVGGGLLLSINSSLTTLNSLTNLTSVGYIHISSTALSDLDGLEGITSITGALHLFANNSLSNLNGLTNLTSIGGYMQIDNNDALINLSGLDNLISIGGILRISSNDALTDIIELNGVTSINGSLLVFSNPNLASLNGLENIDHLSISSPIILSSCSNLSTCEVQSICDYLDNGGTASISNNTTGCNSVVEVETACGALPVELTYFNAQTVKDKVHLYWQTVSEINNQGFHLQKTKDGKEWSDLVFIEGLGNSFRVHEYQFVDKQPYYGMNYYRLKQMDYDESYEYSDVVSVRFDSNTNELAFSPNPSFDFLNVKVPKFHVGEKTTIYIRDVNGHIIKQENHNSHEFQINISKLPQGVYLIQVNDQFAERFIKQ